MKQVTVSGGVSIVKMKKMSNLIPEPLSKIVQEVLGELKWYKRIPDARLPDKIWEEISEEEYNKLYVEKKR